jgi:hypothetical protein
MIEDLVYDVGLGDGIGQPEREYMVRRSGVFGCGVQ